MKRMKMRFTIVALLLTLGLILSACGNKDSAEPTTPQENTGGTQQENTPAPTPEPTPEPVKEPDPVTLTFYEPSSAATEEIFMEQYGNMIKEKFPHVSLKFIHPESSDMESQLSGLLASQEVIDVIILSDLMHYRIVTPFKFQYDMSDLIKKHNYDLNQLAPASVQFAKGISDGGMYALPYGQTTQALMYNRDLFDRFGVDAPRDGMTWDEVYDVANSMSRIDNDVTYRGLITHMYEYAWSNQLSVNYVDPQTDQVILNSDDRWTQIVQNINRFFEIPNNRLTTTTFRALSNQFWVDQIASMYAYSIPGAEREVNWDMVSYPEYSHLRGVGPQAAFRLAYVTNLSPSKDAAFEVIAYLTSEEAQSSFARRGMFIPVIENDQVKSLFGQDVTYLEGKNIQALTFNSPASPFPISEYNRPAALVMSDVMFQLALGNIADINTALREAAEAAEKSIAEAKSK